MFAILNRKYQYDFMLYTGCHKYVPFARFPNKRNVCKNEEKLLERLHQAILEVIDNPQKTQQTTAIGALF